MRTTGEWGYSEIISQGQIFSSLVSKVIDQFLIFSIFPQECLLQWIQASINNFHRILKLANYI